MVAKPPSPIVELVGARLKFSRQRVEGPLQADVGEASALCSEGIVKFIQKVASIKIEDAEQIHEQVCGSILTSERQKDVLDALDSKVDVSGDTNSAGKQTMRYPEHYQSDANWLTYNTEFNKELRLQSMAVRLKACGCLKLTEPSFADAASIALSNTRVSPEELLDGTRTLKKYFSTVPPNMYMHTGPLIFPEDVTVLQASHPALWAQIQTDGAITQSRLQAAHSAIVKSKGIARKSSSALMDKPKCKRGFRALEDAISPSQYWQDPPSQHWQGPSQQQYEQRALPWYGTNYGGPSGAPPVAAPPVSPPAPPEVPEIADREQVVEEPASAGDNVKKWSDAFLAKAKLAKPMISKKDKAKQAKQDASARKKIAVACKRPAAIKVKKIEKCKLPGKSTPEKKGKTVEAWDKLSYAPKVTAPRHYGGITVYVDIGRQLYRVKPAPGSRKTIKRPLTKEGWAEVVQLVQTKCKP